MAIFAKKAEQPEVRRQRIAALTAAAFAGRGRETTIHHLDAPQIIELRGEGGESFPLRNLLDACELVPERKWARMIARHVEAMISVQAQLPAAEMDPTSLREGVRARIIPDGPPDKGWYDGYAREFAPGLLLMLCLDRPQTVQSMNAETVAELSLSVDELFEYGLRNTMAEPIDERKILTGRTAMLHGQSLFVAAKAAGMQHLVATEIGPAPLGLVFGIPDRHSLVYSVLRDAKSLSDIQTTTAIIRNIYSGMYGPTPGGPLSDNLYFWRDGALEVAGGWNPEEQAFALVGEGQFLQSIEEIARIE